MREEYLTKAEAESLDRAAIVRYYNSALYHEIAAANFTAREFAFQAQLGKEDLSGVIPDIGEHRVTVQGIADLLFEKDEGFVLVDFKTDRVSELSELDRRYRTQLSLYAKIIEQVTRKPVKEKVIYSLYLGQSLQLD